MSVKSIDRQIDNIIDREIIKPIEERVAEIVSFVPSDISNLVVRFNADYGISESGGGITSWTDQENSIIATAYNSPTLLNNQLNGRKAVSFDGADDYFTFSLPTAITDTQKRTFVVIGRYNEPQFIPQMGYLNTPNFDDSCYIFKNAFEDQSYYYTQGNQLQGPSVSLSNYHITTVVHNGIPDTNFIRINGQTSFDISYGTIDFLPTLTDFVIGGRYEGSEILYGEIIELLIYNKELTTQEIQQLEDYANIQ
jgi:hypothetical protein